MSKEFLQICEKAFAPLKSDFGLSLVSNKESTFGAEATYANSTTGVKAALEGRDARIFIMLFRLIDGKMPTYESVGARDRDLDNGFDITDLLTLRNAPERVSQKATPPLSTQEMLRVLSAYSEALRAQASDVLRGDFQVFPELRELVQQRAAALRAR